VLSGAADPAEVVELGIHAVANGAAVAGERRRLVGERGRQPIANVREVIELGDQAADERRTQLRQQQPHPRDGGNRLAQRGEIARPRGAERGTADQALDIVDGLERLAHLRPLGAAKGELLDRVETILDALDREQRPQQPRTEQPAAHRRHRAIDLVEQRPPLAAVGRLHDLEVPQRRRIDRHAVGAAAEADGADVGQIRFLRVAEVLHQRPRGADSGTAVLEAESLQRLGAKLRQQRAARRLEVERPAVGAGQARRQTQLVDQGGRLVESLGREDLARAENQQLVGQRRASRLSRILRRRELTRGEIQQGGAVGGAVPVSRTADERHQESRLARFEVSRVRQRAGGHDAHDLALDDTLRFARVFHLLADRDAEALLHQPRDVGVRRVVRHTAHRDRAAVRVLGSGCQGELEGTRGRQRVLVEHLVEVAHPEKQQGVAMLALRVEILAHRGRGARGNRRDR
jgi:hypothetical protein